MLWPRTHRDKPYRVKDEYDHIYALINYDNWTDVRKCQTLIITKSAWYKVKYQWDDVTTTCTHQQLLEARQQIVAAWISKENAANILTVDMKPFEGRLKPIESTPGLWTLNGCGTTLLGCIRPSNQSPRYFTRRFFTLLWVPILPLGIYLVSALPNNMYRFHGQIDAADFHAVYPAKVLWRFYLSAGAVSIALGIAIIAFLLGMSYLGGLLGAHGVMMRFRY